MNALDRFQPAPLPRIKTPKKIAPRIKPPKIAAPAKRRGAY